ncbi:MAG: SDR family NAD(P)-dependent oxidoreductase [Acidobacteriota bacterium]|nr:SDR family NAD(P)-dependent oxidoreductase [Acidobacteriota bacterium]
MKGTLTGKVVLITGAAGGIGTAIARAVTNESAKVVLCDINTEGVRRLADCLTREGKSAAAYTLDISRPSEISTVVEKIVTEHERIDVLVNNAAICPRIPLEEVTEADFDRIVGINLKGTFFVSQAVSPVMVRQGSGRIVNISSVGARTGGVAASSVYAATKAGIIAITKSYARTLAPNVTVNAIAPGVVDTDMMRIPSEQVAAIVDQIPLGRLGDPEEIASVVVFLASEEASYFTGATLDVNGGWFMY